MGPVSFSICLCFPVPVNTKLEIGLVFFHFVQYTIYPLVFSLLRPPSPPLPLMPFCAIIVAI